MPPRIVAECSTFTIEDKEKAERVLQVVTDGMKLAPTGPTFLQERDAIISAANAISAADADDVREGFRKIGNELADVFDDDEELD